MSISQHDGRVHGDDHPKPSPIDALIRDARAGSSAALGQLMQGCRKYLLLVANRKLDSDLRPKAGASDLVQDTFFDAQRDFAQFRGASDQEFFAWLTAIMEHRLANHVRRYRGTHMRDVHREIPLDADEELAEPAANDLTPGGLAANRDEERQVTAAIARLPAQLRQVLTLRAWERASYVEIGAALDISADAARQQWGRAVRRLRQELRTSHDD